jgi:hypothetical protein
MTLDMARHFEAVWRLTHSGEWIEVQASSSSRTSAIAQIIELFASMCAETWTQGAEITARVGERTVMARCDERGVLIGLHAAQANPMMIRTAMSRIEQTSMRTSFGARSVTWSSREADAPPMTSRRSAALQPSSSPFVVADAVEAIDFDQFLGDEPSVMASSRSREAEPEPRCSWEGVASYVRRALEAAATLIGRTVAANYWREAMRAEDRIASALRIDMRGQIEAEDPERRVETLTAMLMDEALARWVLRCQRVIPNIDSILGALGAPPWRAPR